MCLLLVVVVVVFKCLRYSANSFLVPRIHKHRPWDSLLVLRIRNDNFKRKKVAFLVFGMFCSVFLFEGAFCLFLFGEVKVKELVAQSCPTLQCSPPGSSVHGILQARILEWVAISFCRGSSQPRDPSQVSSIAGTFFTDQAPKVTFKGEWMGLQQDFFENCNYLYFPTPLFLLLFKELYGPWFGP